MTKRISEAEITELYKKWHTPDKVKAHCRAVSQVAAKLAEELNRHGYNLDVDLIRGTGLVHDVARTEDEHALVGYGILKIMGYMDEAEIVRVHMTYPQYNSVDKLNECDIVCIADRVVKEDTYVGLDERIDYILKKAEGKPDVQKKILKKKEETRILLDEIGEIIGKSLDELFAESREAR